MENLKLNSSLLAELASTAMPYGKYQGKMISDIPEHYLVWIAAQGFPSGKLGQQLALAYEIRLNGLDSLLTPLKMNTGAREYKLK
jgi:uncharacterized protein (DUF3820 family)